jgi:hypothetical protein
MPYILPDGRHYLYLAWSQDPSNSVLYAGVLGSKERTRIMPADCVPVVYAMPGYLLFHRMETLFAQPFLAGKLQLTGVMGNEVALTVSPASKYVEDWSRDGRHIVYVQADSMTLSEKRVPASNPARRGCCSTPV